MFFSLYPHFLFNIFTFFFGTFAGNFISCNAREAMLLFAYKDLSNQTDALKCVRLFSKGICYGAKRI